MVRTFAVAAAVTLVTLAACSSHRPPTDATSPPSDGASATKPPAAPGDLGPPLDFVLDPIRRDDDFPPASEQLRGKRAIVLLLSSSDGSSSALLMRLAPLLRELPPDATCMLVAMEPLENRILAETLMDSEDTPCLRAMGDRSRGRLGDLAKINVVPVTIVLRADGRALGVAAGVVHPDVVRDELEKAK